MALTFRSSQEAVILIVDMIPDNSERQEDKESYGAPASLRLGIGLSKGDVTLFANEALLDIFGYASFEEFSEVPLHQHISVGLETLRGELAVEGKFECHIRKDGRTICVSVSGLEICNERYILYILRDVTEQKRAEDALRQSEDKFRILSERSLIGIYIVHEGKVAYSNPMLKRIFGYPEDERMDVGLEKLIHPDDLGKVMTSLEERKKGKLPEGPSLIRAIRKDGSVIHVEVYGTLIEFQGGQGIIGNLVNVSEAMVRENEIRKSRDMLNSLIDSAADAIISIDRNGMITAWNNTAAQMSGLSKKQMMNENIFSGRFSGICSSIAENMKFVLETSRTKRDECEINSEARATLLGSFSPILGREGVEGAIFIGRNMTAERRIHNELRIGTSYLSMNESIQKIIRIVALESSCRCLILSRREEELKTALKDMTVFSYPNEPLEGRLFSLLIDKIEKFISLNKDFILILDRIDYLSIIGGFESMLKFLYSVNDMTHKYGGRCIVHVHPAALSSQQLELLKSEFNLFPARFELSPIDERRLNILKFISDRNAMNIQVNNRMISRSFGLSRMTTYEWLKALEKDGLISSTKVGNTKELHATDKALAILGR